MPLLYISVNLVCHMKERDKVKVCEDREMTKTLGPK